MDIRDKLKLLVEEQFPEYYREEYPQMIEFIKQYYNFLESTHSGRVSSFKDIDNTLDEFVKNLKEDFAKNIPQFGQLDDRQFLIFAKEFYASRGSEDSYRFLFRALYGKEIDVFYPSTVILRASDGHWEQELSILIDTDNGVTDEETQAIVGNRITITNTASGRELTILVNKVRLVSTGLYEVFIDRFFSGEIETGDSVVYGANFSGTISIGASTVTIVDPGAGFIEGSYFEIPGTQTLKIRVKKVDSTGGILRADIISPGEGFGSGKYATIIQSSRTATGTSNSVMTATGNEAVVQIVPGPLLRYPGFYSSSNGFLSDVMRLQDNDYYQAYSYVIKLDEQISSYKAIVKRLLHPAGMALWGEYNISNTFNISVDLDEVLPILSLLLQEFVYPTDTLTLTINKALEDTAVVTELLSITTDKSLSETVTMSDSGSIEIQVTQDYGAADLFSEVYAKGTPSTISTW